jgi:hypothetical protein
LGFQAVVAAGDFTGVANRFWHAVEIRFRGRGLCGMVILSLLDGGGACSVKPGWRMAGLQ